MEKLSLNDRLLFTGKDYTGAREYWLEQLEYYSSGEKRLLFEGTNDLVPPVSENGFPGRRVRQILNRAASGAIWSLCRDNELSVYMYIITAYVVLLHKYTDASCVTVAIPLLKTGADVSRDGCNELLPVICRVAKDDSFKDLLVRIGDTVLNAARNQHYPLGRIAIDRDLAFGREIFDTSIHCGPLQKNEQYRGSDLPCTVDLKMDKGEISLEISVLEDSAFSIVRFSEHLQHILSSSVERLITPIGELDILIDQDEKNELLKWSGGSSSGGGGSSGLSGPAFSFREALGLGMEREGLREAIRCGERSVSYGELRVLSGELRVRLLKEAGVRKGDRVVVLLPRSEWMVIALVSLLEGGLVYVPVDESFPEERIRYMLKDVEAKAVICTGEQVGRVRGWGYRVVDVGELGVDGEQAEGEAEGRAGEAVVAEVCGEDEAYIIYTSGSTGVPKGVEVSYGNLDHFFGHICERYGKGGAMNMPVMASASFDISLFQVLTPLLTGGRSVLVEGRSLEDMGRLTELLGGVTEIDTVPALYQVLLDHLEDKEGWREMGHIRRVFIGGDVIGDVLLRRLSEVFRSAEITVTYGPTEGTIFCTERSYGAGGGGGTAGVGGGLQSGADGGAGRATGMRGREIGRPIGGAEVYVLGSGGELLPVGVEGEIWLSGGGVAQGYLHQEEQTGEKFRPHRYGGRGMMYATGDRGRWTGEGMLEFRGRKDDQVKIRGYRIETGEIERVLERSGKVGQVVVVAKEDGVGGRQLAGYVAGNGRFDKKEIMSYLGERLPEYMIPRVWVELPSLPLTSNGKIDRRGLEAADVAGEYEGAGNEREAVLVGVWQELLGRERIGIRDNFFELGGHSLLATRVVSAIRRELGVELGIKDLFGYPTIGELSGYLGGQKKGLLLPGIGVWERPERIPLSFSQERLWFIDQLEGSVQYHMLSVLRLKGKLEEGGLEYALRGVVNRHEVLRTVIREGEGKAYQQVMEKDGWELDRLEGRGYKPEDGSVQGLIEELISRPFDLGQDHLMRAHLIRVEEEEYILVVILHHIASDGWSMSVMVGEIVELYGAYVEKRPPALPALPIQYADYALWQRQYLDGEWMQSGIRYWQESLKEITPIHLPTDHPRPAVAGIRGAIRAFAIDKEMEDRLRKLSRQQGTTLFMTLLAAFKVLLYRYSGQQNICVGVPVTGRERQETEGLIGFFLNTLALKDTVSDYQPFTGLLRQVKQTTLEAYEHQEVPFAKVVEAVVKERDVSGPPLVQVMFDFQSGILANIPDANLPGIELSYEDVAYRTSKFDITFTLTEGQDGLRGAVEYSTDLYNEETIARMTGHYLRLLEGIVKDPSCRISELEMLDARERDWLLKEVVLGGSSSGGDGSSGLSGPVFSFREALGLGMERGGVREAIRCGERSVSYGELRVLSGELRVRLLKEAGVRKGDRVVVLLPRSEWMVIALVSLLEGGLVYVPVDESFPEERIRYMLKDVEAKAVICTGEQVGRVRGWGYRVVDVGELGVDGEQAEGEAEGRAGEAVVAEVCGEDEAYIIYTSGSTGVPKGVEVSYGNLDHFFGHICERYGKGGAMNMPVMASASFDISLFQVLTPLLTGGRSVLVEGRSLEDMGRLTELLGGVTEIDTVPALYQVLLDHLEDKEGWREMGHIRRVFIGGDVIGDVLLRRLSEVFRSAEITVTYGPTEGTIFCTERSYGAGGGGTAGVGGGLQSGADGGAGRATGMRGREIGRPIGGAEVYVLGSGGELLPVGVEGEIWLSGGGVAQGYLHQEEQTGEKFRPHRYGGRGMMYATGDRGRWTGEGMLEFRGRKDDQVKIRGYRIETGEIENCIKTIREIDDVVVTAVDDRQGNKTLAAYYVEKLELQIWPSISEYLGYNDLAYYAMTSDALRATSYKEAIYQAVKGKTVVDIGTGPEAILARHCIDAGAEKVYAIEILEEVYLKARAKIEALGLGSKIILIHGDSMNVQLPEKVDYCVCALVGNLGSSDGCIPIMNGARRFLKDPTRMIPYRSLVKIAAIHIPEDTSDYRFTEAGAYYINNIFGNAGRTFDVRLGLQNVSGHHLVTTSDIFEDLDLTGLLPAEEERGIELRVTADSTIDGFLLWLNLYTSPDILNDIFKSQKSFLPIYFPVFASPVEVRKGDVIRARVWRKEVAGTIYPDYGIEGELVRSNGDTVPFSYMSERLPGISGDNRFYKKVFPGGAIVPKPSISTPYLREYLEHRLPHYMVPGHFIKLAKIALTSNGKKDRRSLPDPYSGIQSGESHAEPRNPVESRVLKIWQDLLGMPNAGIYDDFFELGGHSLLATRVVSAIRKEMDADLTIRDLFMHPTVADLAGTLRIKDKGQTPAPMERQTRSERIPLSFAQERLWFIDQLEGSLQYHIPMVLRLSGNLNTGALEQALQYIIERHEVLRTVIIQEEGQAYQHILAPGEWRLTKVERGDHAGDPRLLQMRIEEFIAEPFDLSADHPIRAGLIRLDANEYILVATMHHIAADGWSLHIIVRELTEAYGTCLEGRAPKGRGLPVQYADVAIWQRRYFEGEAFEKKVSSWKTRLQGLQPLGFPTDLVRQPVQSTNGAIVVASLEEDILARLRKLGREQGASLFMTLLSAFKVLLYRYTGQQDICIGSPVAGRSVQETEGLIGFFVNILVLRTAVNGTDAFTDILQKVKETTLHAFDNQDVPFEKVVDAVAENRDRSRNPLFDVKFALHNVPDTGPLDLGSEISLTPEPYELKRSQIDISLDIQEHPHGLQLTITYCTDLYRRELMEQLLRNYIVLLRQITEAPAKRIDLLDILSVPERETLTNGFNDTFMEYPEDKTIVDLFREQALRTPGGVALIFEGRQMTYRELDERSNRLGHYLRNAGVGEDTLVPICCERSFDMILGILGVLKAGGAYLPMDPTYPADRIKYMLEDAGSVLVVTNSINQNAIPEEYAGNVLLLDAEWDLISCYPGTTMTTRPEPHHLAYVIYTSGSTGAPKGVLIEHVSVVNICLYHIRELGLGEDDCYLQFMAPAFDAAVLDIFNTLLSGGTLLLPDKEIITDSRRFLESIDHYRVTLFTVTPSYLSALEKAPMPGVRIIISGGEAASVEDAMYYSKTKRFYNGYGPAEATVTASLYKVKADRQYQTIPIGQPTANKQLYVLNEVMQLNPPGVIGEIVIAGAGLARGYLNQPEMTEKKFVRNPFGATDARLYKTGDLGRWLPDGSIEYCGRVDQQVKIRGYRIELGEIENVLLQSESVRQAVVLVKQTAHNGRHLVAYIVPGREYDRQTVADHIAGKLPEYMRPVMWVEMENFPLTSNGKIDKAALPEPGGGFSSVRYVAPRTEEEMAIAGIWSEILGVEKVGVHDDFFKLGGDSIRIITVIGQLRNRLHKEIKVSEVYQATTLEQLAEVVKNAAHQQNEVDDIRSAVQKEMILLRETVLPLLPEPDGVEDIYLISDIQYGMIYTSLLRPEAAVYHDQMLMPLSKDMDPAVLERAVALLASRHAILRTAFDMNVHPGGVQVVRKSVTVKVEYRDLRDMDEEAVREYTERYLSEERAIPFRLDKAPLWRCALFSARHYSIFIFQCHHAILDGWSIALLNTELNNLYLRIAAGEDHPALPPVKCSYKEFIVGNSVAKRTGEGLEFWKKEMEGYRRLEIFSQEDECRQLVRGYDRAYFELLNKKTAAENISLKGLFLGAYILALGMLTNEDELTLGLVGNNRPLVDGGDQVLGCFLNTIPFRTAVPDGRRTWREYLRAVEDKLSALRMKDRTTLVEIAQQSPDNAGNENPFFDVLFNFINFHIYDGMTGDLSAFDKPGAAGLDTLGHGATNTFLDCSVNITGNVITLIYSQRKQLRSGKSLLDLHAYVDAVIDSYLRNCEGFIDKKTILSPDEYKKVTEVFNNAAYEYSRERTVMDMFEDQAARTPDAIAVACGEEEMSYRQLDERSNQLGHYLRSRGIKADMRVPVCMERSCELIVAILGILKAGAAYVPIDPAQPADRIRYMAENAGAGMILVNGGTLRRLEQQEIGLPLVDIDGVPGAGDLPRYAPVRTTVSSNLAYVIYTSGSTGRPKGAGVIHRGLSNLIQWYVREFLIDRHDRNLVISSIGFDLTQKNIFSILATGGVLVLLPASHYDSAIVQENISSKGITIVNSAPSAFYPLVEDKHLLSALHSLRLVVLGGEPIQMNRFSHWIQSPDYHCEIINSYGPTECTDIASFYRMKDPGQYVNRTIPLGRPNDNVQLFILNKSLGLQAIGVMGEICIAGEGVGAGYINDKELTELKFLDNPFGQGKIYRTGDLGRWLPDGNVEYLGRMDDQVKIRGHRIELGEIERVLEQSGCAQQAVVMVQHDDKGEGLLVGYLVCEQQPDREEIRRRLKEHLPDYMIPSIWVGMDRLPLTTNGKVDKGQLPKPERAASEQYMAPRNQEESVLAEIWSELLGRRNVGVYDNFFVLGGHSLTATRVVSAIRGRLGIEVSISGFFDNPTIAGLAGYIRGKDAADTVVIRKVPERPPYLPLSFSQERIWIIDQVEGSSQFIIPAVFRLHGQPDPVALQSAFREIVNRHEVLRTVIRQQDGRAYQYILPENLWQLPVVAMEEGDGLQCYIQDWMSRPFDLSSDHMLRVELLNLGPDSHLMMVAMHHISSDGWSMSIIVRELAILYNACLTGEKAELAPLAIQYADFALWQRGYLQGELLEQKIRYWGDRLKDVRPLDLPTDFSRPAVQSFRAGAVHFILPRPLSQRLNKLSVESGSTLFMAMLAAFEVLLHRYTGQNDITVGTPIAGRQQHEVEGLIGCFINTLVLRNHIDGDMTFAGVLRQVTKSTTDAYDHQEVPFEKVVETVVKKRDMSRSPLFQVLFAMQNMPDAPAFLPGNVRLTAESAVYMTAKYDLSVYITENQKGLEVSIEYCSDLYKEETVRRLASNYERLLGSIVADPLQTIAGLPVMTEEEYRLLRSFNNTEVAYPKNETVLHIFERQVANAPDALAVISGDRRLTYKELDEWSWHLAAMLRAKGAGQETLIPLLMDRGPELVIAILGVLKAGAAYVPLDPSHPQERIGYILEDISANLILTTEGRREGLQENTVKDILTVPFPRHGESPSPLLEVHRMPFPASGQLAYVIYTSGSTGKPKGVMVEHGNLLNFCVGMDRTLPIGADDHLLAITSISFDISLLELIWTICRGIKVTISDTSRELNNFNRYSKDTSAPEMAFGLFYFASQRSEGEENIYDFLLRSAAFADEHHFTAIWLPERHFHAFGGIFPNPAVLGAAVAAVTKNVEIRAGSVVLPLNDVIRVAESWSVVDNLSGGRVALSIASGWHADDFALMPGNFSDRHAIMYRQIEELKALWKGEGVTRKNGLGKEIEVNIYPRPVRGELPLWITSGGSPETFRKAGEMGVGVLTHLLGQRVDDLEKNILVYKRALRENGYPVKEAKIALMLHTYIGEDEEKVKKEVRTPFKDYLRSSIDLLKTIARSVNIEAGDMEENAMDEILDVIFERYWQTSALLGTVDSCSALVKTLYAIGVTEIACLIDFGVEKEKVIDSLTHLEELRRRFARCEETRKPADPGITALQITPSYLGMLLEDIDSRAFLGGLKHILIGGEKLPAGLVNELSLRTDAEIYNMYGPTETTVWSAVKNVKPFTNVTIGKPIANTKIHILDAYGNLCPIGVIGELCIAGDGVSRGYFRREVLTRERYVRSTAGGEEALLYRTGDMARWLPCGEIEIIGRNDDQVKLRGYRIEPAEIQEAIQGYGKVSRSVVSVKANEHGKEFLVAYVQVKEGFVRQSLLDMLKKKLPEFMVPAFIVELDELPLTSNGKVDKNALPAPSDRSADGHGYAAPRNPEEEKIAAVWQELLGTPRMGIHDNFFEFGGDSIITIQVASRLKRAGFEIRPRDLFVHQTIAELSAGIRETPSVSFAEQGRLLGDCGLLPIQQSYLEKGHASLSHFNQSMLLEISKEAGGEELDMAVEKLIGHHDALRCIFHRGKGEWRLEYGATSHPVIREDLRHIAGHELGDRIAECGNSYQRSLDIEKGILMRVVWMQTPDTEETNRLLIIIHHLVIDGVSWRILLDDLELLLNGIVAGDPVDLGKKTSSCRQWYNALEKYGRSRRLLAQAEYWKTIAQSYEPITVDRENDAVITMKGMDNHTGRLPSSLTRQLLQDVPRVYNTEINDILLAAMAKTLSRWMQRDKVIIGMEGHGREDIIDGEDVSRTIGWFTSLYPLLLEGGLIRSDSSLIREVKEQLRLLPDKGMGYGVLKYINKDVHFKGERPWDIQFNYLGQFDHVMGKSRWFGAAAEFPGDTLSGDYPTGTKIEVNGMITGGELVLHWSYSRMHYDRETIVALSGSYMRNLEMMIAHALEQGKSGVVHSPSDFGLGKEITVEELDNFLNDSPSKGDVIMEF